MKTNFRKRGLTLMEIIIAAVLFAMVSAGLLGVFVASRRNIMHSRSRATASKLVSELLDSLQMQVRQDQWGNNCVSNDAFCSAFETPITVPNDPRTYTPNFTVTAPPFGTNLRKVVITLTWQEN